MNISVALTNLRKYNEGELVFTWLDLPATDEEIAEALEKIGIASETRYEDSSVEEYFISDNNAPFHVGEYDNVDDLNEKAEMLEDVDSAEEIMNGEYDASDVINFANDLESEGYIGDAHDFIGDIVDSDMLDVMVTEMISGYDAGWERVKIFLEGINFMNEDYYYIDGYGNADDLTEDTLDAVVYDLLAEIDCEIE